MDKQTQASLPLWPDRYVAKLAALTVAERHKEMEAFAFPQNIHALLCQAADECPQTLAWNFFETGQTITYAELRRQVDRLAEALVRFGIGQRSRVGVMLPNCPEMPLVWLSLARIGAVMVPVNLRYTGRELAYELLIRALAYAIQEKAFGGLSLAATKRLQAIARDAKASKASTASEARSSQPRRRLMPGTRLIREWQGVMHEVIVIPDGFLWQGATYASLSTVAKAITGTSWNGWVFFGAKPPPKKPKRTGTDPSPSGLTSVDAGASVTLSGSDAHA
ncbi:MAG: DUF2924 domain-containing protein [Phreatobacter sp.]|uniref:DUF2924 domain-containing protein n=1 Tax=Phreatobacter sp. TaxID=1966341 RepID=UPI001A4DD80E|nr:DUF2924 domain-containing protein [Phreatobacter sp.]MBL8571403.1 DUF2924 domain-containing protein [Phreatobacter sp.]